MIPQFLLYRFEVIFDVPFEFTKEKLLSNTQYIPVISVTKYTNDTTTPGYEPVKITKIKFLGNKIPRSTRIYEIHFRVSYSDRKPEFCINCFRHGYGNHLSNNCDFPQDRPSTCINFKDDHTSDSSFCPLYEEKIK